jgi:N-methylhydantoinase B
VIRFQSCGGGGWGHPFDRDTGLVLADVRGGYVSLEAARSDYGVVLRIQDDEVHLDAAATATLRAGNRHDAKLFHNGQYVDAMN